MDSEPMSAGGAPSRRELLKAAAAVSLLTACHATGRAPDDGRARPRNLLVLVSDDQSRCDLGAYGNTACPTPHINGLAADGMRFDRAYTPTSICMPSRTCYYTGLYPHQNGATGFEPVRPGVATWPELLAGHCATGMVGKFNVRPRSRFPFEYFGGTGILAREGRLPVKYEHLSGEFLPPEEPFDLERDPWELENPAADPDHAEVLRGLQHRLREWMERTGDPLLAEWPA